MKQSASIRPGAAKSRWSAFIRSRRASVALLAAFVVIAWAKPFGLLLWARIRILTNIPRTAIADDPAKAPAAAPEPEELDTGFAPASEIRMDPFRIDPQRFPNPTPEAREVPAPQETPKPAVPSADDTRREAFESARRAADRFRLQTAGRGLSMAVIDGRTRRVGDTIESDGVRFTLVEVLEGGAVLECDAGRFELSLRGTPPVQGKSRGGS